jgi:membrane protein DedA with SNARE-associated domain
MDAFFDVIQQFWLDFQHGQAPDIGSWNYMLMAVFMMMQGRVSAVLGGVVAAAGYLNLGLIILVALAARVIVDLFWYKVGSTGYVDRIGRRIGAYERVADRVQEGIRQKPVRFVLLAKLSNGLSVPATIAAGSARLPIRRWLPVSFAAELLWTVPLLLVGYFGSDVLGNMEGGLSYFTLGISAVFMLFIVLYLVRSRRNSARQDS